ncbi:MAG: chemotaxis-specific protein-glutamate methyltransferase CheB [Chlorobi bacterium]|nr:chemotaxis-specific protein-glutamate methyltransferase CheB [Chlorobiota bacterium]
MITILVVDDSLFVREQVKAILSGEKDIVVVGEARNGREAVSLTRKLAPDVIIMDVDMDGMDGIEATRHIMEECPAPIVIHTSSTIARERNVPFEAMKMGALDLIRKPDIYPLTEELRKEFLNKIKIVAGIKVFRRRKRVKPSFETPVPGIETRPLPKILAIAASTGGPKAIYDILSQLPSVVPFPILIVQHIGASFVEGFVEWLQTATSIQMRIARDGERLVPNACYLSPGTHHLSISKNETIVLRNGSPVNSCKPSADVLFESVAAAYGKYAVGLLLTGIGQDGAKGLKQIKLAGGMTLVQDESSSIVFGMPKAAIEKNAAVRICPLDRIPRELVELFRLN